MTEKEKWLRMIEGRGCDEIPCTVSLSPATWARHRENLEQLVIRYPDIFGDYEPGRKDFDAFDPVYRQDEQYTDNWGCVWDNRQGGLEGQIVHHPLADWSNFDAYRAPDPLAVAERVPRPDWGDVRAAAAAARAEGRLVRGSGDRYFERLHFVRGFSEFLMDVAEDSPRIAQLSDLILQHNMTLVERWLEIGADLMYFGDDLGMQDRLIIHPDKWRRHIKPGYATMHGTCRRAGAHVFLHSDGYILDILPDLIDVGVSIVNPQDRVNGIDNIARICKGRVCICLDIDRQRLLPFGTPREIREHIRECVIKLGSPAGQLMLTAWVSHDAPLCNLVALCDALREFRSYHAGR